MANEISVKLTNEEWLDILRGEASTIDGSGGIYRRVPLIYRAFRLRCNSIASVPVRIYRGKSEEELEEWPFVTSAYDLIWNIQASLLAKGKAYIVPNAGKLTGRARDFQVLNPFCVSEDMNADGSFTFRYQPSRGTVQMYGQDEIIWLWEHNVSDYTAPGPGACEVALNDARLVYYLTRFPGVFFERGAMPVTLVAVKTTLDAEIRKIEAWFKAKMTGLANAFGIAAFKADTVSISTLTPPLNQMSFPELTTQARQAIADAFELPVTLVSDAANYATAEQHDQQFWETAVKPTGMRICAALNKFLKTQGYRLEFDYEELSAFQTDENERALSLNHLTGAGVPLSIALRTLGYDLEEEDWAKIEEAEKKPEPQPAVPDPAFQGTGAPQEPPGNTNLQEARSALATYRRKVLHALKRGEKPAGVEFVSSAIDERTMAAIRYELEAATDEAGVKAAFEAAQPVSDEWERADRMIARLEALAHA